jgi:hypothetical protein
MVVTDDPVDPSIISLVLGEETNTKDLSPFYTNEISLKSHRSSQTK